MKRFRWLLGAAVAAAVFAACSQDVVSTDPGWYLNHHDRSLLLDSAQAVDSATKFMAGVGCVPVLGNTPGGSVMVEVPSAGRRIFDCHALGVDSTHRVIRAFH